jgi:mycothiol system anti-sigma-R factor
MSCSDSHDVDCTEVLAEVYLYLDDENLAGRTREEVRHHLEECAPCLAEFGIEREVQALVARCCGGDIAPVAVRERVRATLTAMRIDLTTVDIRVTE